ncbi:60S acidic ribosomal protein P0 [Trichonephila clavata]|uniref:Large ribosomal subunit protein uL10 n=1 Tax=Trichonephila clavata TaxID=2740835 RepID=A0A8X6HSU6_TRICU|nr:60S acidic ribosomal protein P0 [Trichonephila clavata]
MIANENYTLSELEIAEPTDILGVELGFVLPHGCLSTMRSLILPHIRGNVGFVFTKLDLVDIREKIMSNKVKAPARAGATAPCDVILSPQNTGLGPEKTSFFQALQIPTKISKGTIEILPTSLVVLELPDLCSIFHSTAS